MLHTGVVVSLNHTRTMSGAKEGDGDPPNLSNNGGGESEKMDTFDQSTNDNGNKLSDEQKQIEGQRVNPAMVPLNPRVEEKRVRQYGEEGDGPYVVYVRSVTRHALNVTAIADKLLKKFPSIAMLRPVNRDKLRVEFTDKNEANEAVKDDEFKKNHYVYIPAARSEVDGKVFLNTNVDVNEILKNGYGTMRNSTEKCKVVDVYRLRKKVAEEGAASTKVNPKFVDTPMVRITFDGTTLPDYLMVDRLRIPVMPYTPRIMRCAICLLAGHTHVHCSNRLRCKKCGGHHETTEESNACAAAAFVCPNCKDIFRDADHVCSRVTEMRNEKVTAVVEKRNHKRSALLKKASTANVAQAQRVPGPDDFPKLPKSKAAKTVNRSYTAVQTKNPFAALLATGEHNEESDNEEMYVDTDDDDDANEGTNDKSGKKARSVLKRKRNGNESDENTGEKRWFSWAQQFDKDASCSKPAQPEKPVSGTSKDAYQDGKSTKSVPKNTKTKDDSGGWVDTVMVMLSSFGMPEKLLDTIRSLISWIENLFNKFKGLIKMMPMLFAGFENNNGF